MRLNGWLGLALRYATKDLRRASSDRHQGAILLIDGEVVCCDERGVAAFHVLRRRRNEPGAFLYPFDLLELNGTDLRREPIEVRKATLASLLRTSRPGVRLNAHLEHDCGLPARLQDGWRELSRSGWDRATAQADRRTGLSSRTRRRLR